MTRKLFMLAVILSFTVFLSSIEGYCNDLTNNKSTEKVKIAQTNEDEKAETEKLIEIEKCTTAECKDALSDLNEQYLKLEKQLAELAKEAPGMDEEHKANMESVIRGIDLNQTELTEGNCILLRPLANDLAIFTANYYSVLSTEDKEILDLEDDITKSVEDLNEIEERILMLEDTTKQPEVNE